MGKLNGPVARAGRPGRAEATKGQIYLHPRYQPSHRSLEIKPRLPDPISDCGNLRCRGTLTKISFGPGLFCQHEILLSPLQLGGPRILPFFHASESAEAFLGF